MSESNNGFSVARLLMVLAPVLLVALLVRNTIPGYEQEAQKQLEANMLSKLLASGQITKSESIDFTDSDGDLLADFPADDATVTPEKLVFSYVGPPEEVDESETWADLITALGEATGLPAEYRHYESSAEQIKAMATGELHVVGLNTGAVPTAVEAAGFHPVCTFGKEDGSFGYTMKLLAPASSGVEDPSDLAGKNIAFTTPDSNSGCKAAVVYLMDQQDMVPVRDYEWRFTYGHETSIKELAEGKHDAAPVASDILERMVNDGEVADSAFQVVYESERFPPATIGFAHNLAPTLRDQITQTLTSFAWPGTSVEAKYGPSGATQFVAVNYKNDWANIRRINTAGNVND